MSLDFIDTEILKIVYKHRNGLPVGTPTIDRILLNLDENFILNGLLSNKLEELEKKRLIESPKDQIGYTITRKGIELLNTLS